MGAMYRGLLVGKVRRAYTRCPMCRYVFQAPRVGTYVTVGREPDLCPKFPGRQTDGSRVIQSEVTMCPACSFAARDDFDGLDLSPTERYDLEDRLKDDGLLRVFRTNPTPWLAFHAAEVCGQERAVPARDLGDLCLRASWVCRKEKEHPFESTFQLRAVRYFLRALEEEGLHGRELSLTTYLIGELNRRLGNHREALNWYVNAERTIEGSESLTWLD
ncbi:MAG TPA: DUF2225 domain-containing protein, partial [Rubrobacteraceae bacterium]|nr:DUF2225 domain-containing protein [Rubrobacteraceae bacterium]